MRRPYLVRVTTHVRNLDSPEPDREFHTHTLIPCFSLKDAHDICARIAHHNNSEGVRRSCEIVVKVYLDGKTHYVLISQLRSLAEQFSDYYSEYSEDQGRED